MPKLNTVMLKYLESVLDHLANQIQLTKKTLIEKKAKQDFIDQLDFYSELVKVQYTYLEKALTDSSAEEITSYVMYIDKIARVLKEEAEVFLSVISGETNDERILQ